MLTTSYYQQLNQRLNQCQRYKLGFPESLLASDLPESTTNNLVDNTILGIARNSLADQLIVNVGAPEHDSSTFALEVKEVERDVITRLCRHLGSDYEQTTGYVTSGGTEGNFVALWWARQRLLNSTSKQRQQLQQKINRASARLASLERQAITCSKSHDSRKLLTGICNTKQYLDQCYLELRGWQQPVLVYSQQASHYSISKIAEQLCLQPMPIATNGSGTMSITSLAKQIEKRLTQQPNCQFIIAANIGTTIHGAIDDVPQIIHTVQQQITTLGQGAQLHVHADAALLGIALPALEPFGKMDNYLLQLGLDSIAISGHKLLGTSLACGMVLARRSVLAEAFSSSTNIEYAGDINDITFSGCRSGLAVLQLHNAMCSLKLGQSHCIVTKLVNSCLANARKLYCNLAKIAGPANVSWQQNQFNVIFPQPSSYLMRKYQLMAHGHKAIACVLTNVTADLIAEFIADFARDTKYTVNFANACA